MNITQDKISKRITLADVAQRAGVSTGTVSRVFNKPTNGVTVRPLTQEKVRRAARELGYAPNAAARALAAGRTGTIGVVCYDINDPLVPPLLSELGAEAAQRQYQLSINTVPGNPIEEVIQGHSCISLLEERRVDGILVFGECIIESEGYLDNYPEIPFASVVGVSDQGLICAADVDHFGGGVATGQYLASLGHRHVAFFTFHQSNKSGQRRQAGIRAGLENCGGDLICIGEGLQMAPELAGQCNVTMLLQQHPNVTAIVCRNDRIAMGALRGLHDANISVPNELSLLSWGDAYFSPFMTPSLTAMKSPLLEMGRRMLHELLDRLRKPHSSPVFHKIPMELHSRESTAQARGGAL